MFDTLTSTTTPQNIYPFLKWLKDQNRLKLIKLFDQGRFKLRSIRELNALNDNELLDFSLELDPEENDLVQVFLTYAKVQLAEINKYQDLDALEEAFYSYHSYLNAKEKKRIDVEFKNIFDGKRLCTLHQNIHHENLGHSLQRLSEEILVNPHIDEFAVLNNFYLCLRVYLKTRSFTTITDIEFHLKNFFKEIGFDVFLFYQAKEGSWISRQILEVKNYFAKKEVTNAISKGEHALELALIDTKQAAITNDLSQAASSLINALSQVPSANIMLGSLLLVKHTDQNGLISIKVKNLNANQMILLNKSPELFDNPNLLREIEK